MQDPISGYTAKQQQALMKIGEGIVEFWQASGQVPESPERRLLEKYGECMTHAKAARELGCSADTVGNMLRDGRLECVGDNKVSTTSLARYLMNPRTADYETRIKKRQRGAKHPVLTPSARA